MTTQTRIRSTLLLLATPAVLSACDGGVTAVVLPIVISATWTDVHDPDHQVDLRTADDGAARGLLAGFEIHDDCFNPCRLGGHWEEGRIEIVVLRDSGERKFRAHFTEENPTALTFTQIGGAETFTIGR